jgi:glycosyltransferase involved in cell wall biosynthesis
MSSSNTSRRILHVITGLELGGAEALLIECADRGRRHGLEPLVVSLKSKGPNKQRLEERGIEVVELGLSRLLSLPGKAVVFSRCVNAFRPAVTQSWLYDANLFVMLAAAASPHLKRNAVAWGIFGTVPDLRSCSLRLRTAIRAGALFSRYPAAVIYNAELARADHEKFGYRSRRTLVFSNFVDTDRFKPDQLARGALRRQLGIPDDAFVAVTVGRSAPQKSWASLLAVVGEIEGLTTLAVGPGSEDLPAQPGLIRLGSSFAMPALYAAADVFLLASAFGEGTSVAMSEAMACGLPVVVTDSGDNGRFGREAGFAVPTGDLAALAAAIRRLRDDDGLRRALGTMARGIAVDQFSAERALKPVLQLYESLGEASG